MSGKLSTVYATLVLRFPWLSLLLVALLVAGFASQIPRIKLDASADALMLQGDPSLETYREISKRYSSEDFLLITWQPPGPLLADASLLPLKAMAEELRALPGVSSVVTVWDVPLLESPPVSLSDVTSPEPLPSLEQPGIDRELVLEELTTSPIYADLLASRDGDVTAVQINLERDQRYFELLEQREALRAKQDKAGLSAAERGELAEVEARFKAYTAQALEAQSALVESVRRVAAGYSDHADLFVGGVPMIAADMVSFVRSDLVTFGSAILGFMLVVLAIIFRRVRWVVIPLVTCSATVTVMLGLLGALDWRMTVISSNFVAVLLIIALAICIHLIVRYRELHAQDPDGDLYQRVLSTVQLMAVPCLYTGITTIVAFVSLVVSGIQPVIDFGWMMTVGIAVALLLAFVLVPCLMLVWPEGRPHRHAGSDPTITAWFARVTDKRGGAILLVTGGLTLAIALGISRLQVENRFIDYFHESTEIYQGMELLDSKLGGTIPLDIVISPPATEEPLPGLEPVVAPEDATPVAGDDPFAAEAESFDSGGDEFAGGWEDEFGSDVDSFATAGDSDFQPSYWFSLEGMRQLDAVHNYVDSLPETGKVLSLSTVFAVVKNLLGEDVGSVELALVQKSLPADIKGMMVDPYFSADTEQARVTVRVKETSENLRRDQFLSDLRKHLLADMGFAEEQVQLTGMLVLYNNVLQSLFRSQILTIGAVFLAILVMFLLLFRSLPLALIALAPNVLAAGLVLGVMGLLGIPLDIMTITIAAIVVGIGVDDCIHYVHRYLREFPVDRDYRAAMHRCHSSIGRAMYYTTLTVVIGFTTLTLSNFNPSIYFGLLTVLAMIAAVLGALLLLPQLIIMLKPLGPEQQ
ncbi:RND family transporter [Seongchinamella sediminis]|uniref:RND family transporter n=1 Tax=Seongchinamella sediminis TaxID=2283635 RepID=A0A3L7DS27_9GAMM|nr:MMPL family transporter [Seongchinamella sediminis]RLQ20467.1 RND family transporter [Seongchinamella sediminis]